MREFYLSIAGRIRSELQDIQRVVDRTVDIWEQAGNSAEDYYVDAAALNLHGFYAGLERLFEFIADGIDRSKPTGPNWHQELLRQMGASISAVRPEVISSEVRDQLDRYRGFRHVVRNVYTFSLDAEQIGLLIKRLQPVAEQTTNELLAFADFLERVVDEE